MTSVCKNSRVRTVYRFGCPRTGSRLNKGNPSTSTPFCLRRQTHGHSRQKNSTSQIEQKGEGKRETLPPNKKKNPPLFRTFTFVCYICGPPCPGASRPPNPTFADVTFLPAPLLIRQTKLFSVLARTRRGFVAEPSMRQPFGNLHYLAISLSTWTCSDMETVTTIPRPLPPWGPRAPVSRLDRPPH